YTALRNIYKFTAKAKWAPLEAMDLITIPDSKIGIIDLPVRLTSVKENDKYELECEAEPFVYGANAPGDLPVTTVVQWVPGSTHIPSNINVPIIIEPPLRMCLSGSPEIWFVVSDSD